MVVFDQIYHYGFLAEALGKLNIGGVFQAEIESISVALDKVRSMSAVRCFCLFTHVCI